MKYIGCAYYPEYWGRDRVEIDAGLMQAAGVNIVRIGEFAWCRMEPADGVFALDWLHECIQTLGRYGINVILCTPTATPPAWLSHSCPDILLTDGHGHRLEHGTRRHYCYTSETYNRYSSRIVEKLANEFSGYSNVVAWQIDNEPDLSETGGCYCEGCQAQFRQWLIARYVTLENLNLKWGTGFWSMDYTDWKQVRLGQSERVHSPSHVLDTKRFISDALGGFVTRQRAVIKERDPSAVVSTNVNGSIFTSLDFNKIFASMDVAMKDLYFDICTMDRNVLIMDQFRSFKADRKFWITETGAGMCGEGKPSTTEQFQAWMWSSYAHGAEAYVVFRWRTCLSGQEQELEGMLEHSGLPGRRYRKVKTAYHQLREVSSVLGELPPLEADIAIIHDYDVMWSYQSSCNRMGIDYQGNFTMLYRKLYQRQLAADIVSPAAPLDKYRLVILPSLVMVDQDFTGHLQAYIANGGVVLAQGQIGMKDRNGNYLAEQEPCCLQDVLGIRINGGMYLYSAVEPDEDWTKQNSFSLGLSGNLGNETASGTASVWAGDLELNGAMALMTITQGEYSGQPAIAQMQVGSGMAVSAVIASMDDGLLDGLFTYVLGQAGILTGPSIPEHVEVIRRGKVLFVINHRSEAVSITIPGIQSAILGQFGPGGTITMQPYGVGVYAV